MKNKLTTIILAILVCVFAAVVFTACGKCKHAYDNACDTTCNKCDETRTITHTPEADDGDCLTARNCTVCEQVAVASYTEHTDTETDDDWTCDNPGCEHLFAGTLDGLTFTPNEDGESYYVTGLASDFDGTELTIPATVNGKPVTAIGDLAFNHLFHCGFLSVTIPVSVTTIGEDAFIGCFNLTNIYYGGTDVNTWETLSANAEIRSLATVYFYSSDMPEGEGNYWCYDTKGEPVAWKVVLGGVVYQLNNDYESYTLKRITADLDGTELTIPATVNGKPVTAIGDWAFAYPICDTLKRVTIPASVTTIGEGAFYTNALTSVTFGENSQLTTIGEYAFYVCPLKSVVIPASVTSIGDYAYGCNDLTSVYYGGTEADWGDKDKITIGVGAIPYYVLVYYYSENKPEGEGYYWHYDANGVPTTEWDD